MVDFRKNWTSDYRTSPVFKRLIFERTGHLITGAFEMDKWTILYVKGQKINFCINSLG
jgi:hypothetical protein